MEFRILGPVEARALDRPIPLGGPRQRALVAVLLLHRNAPVTTEQLLDALWDDEPPRSGAQAVQNLVLRARKVLGPDRLRTRGGGYELRVDEGELDLARVEALVAEAGQLDSERRAAVLREALVEFRGAPLSGVGGAFASGEAARLDDLRLSILEDRIDADLALGRHSDLVGELAVLAAREPLRERVRGQLILALYRSGRQAEALDAYRETRRLLADELGLEPGPALRELERAVLRQDPALDAPPSGEPRLLAHRWSRRRLVGVATVMPALFAAGGLAVYTLSTGSPATPAVAVAAPASSSVRAARVASSPGSTAMAASETGATTKQHAAPASRSTTRATKRRRAAAPAGPGPASIPASAKAATTAVVRAVARPSPPVETTRTTKTKATTTIRTTTIETTTATTIPPRTPALVRIADDFTRDYRDGTIWHEIVTGTSVEIRPTGGRLVVSIGPDAVPGGPYDVIDGHYGTQCSFPGDFDARVDFELLDWPADAGVSVGLWAFFANAAVVRQASRQWGELYAAWVVPANGSTSLPDRAGSLRLARVDGTITASFWHDGSWRTLVRGEDRGRAVLGPSLQGTPDFGHAAVKVAFDNFSVEARELTCPPGSMPPGG